MDKYILLGLIIRQNLISPKLYMKIPKLMNQVKWKSFSVFFDPETNKVYITTNKSVTNDKS